MKIQREDAMIYDINATQYENDLIAAFHDDVRTMQSRYDELFRPSKDKDIESYKRLFARCYWVLVQDAIAKAGTKQTTLSIRITNESEDLTKTNQNYLAKQIDRNTFPTETIVSRISKVLPDERLRLDNVLESVDSLRCSQVLKLYQSYLSDERSRSSSVLKTIKDMLIRVNNDDLEHVHAFLEMLTNPKHRSFGDWIAQTIDNASDQIRIREQGLAQ